MNSTHLSYNTQSTAHGVGASIAAFLSIIGLIFAILYRRFKKLKLRKSLTEKNVFSTEVTNILSLGVISCFALPAIVVIAAYIRGSAVGSYAAGVITGFGFLASYVSFGYVSVKSMQTVAVSRESGFVSILSKLSLILVSANSLIISVILAVKDEHDANADITEEIKSHCGIVVAFLGNHIAVNWVLSRLGCAALVLSRKKNTNRLTLAVVSFFNFIYAYLGLAIAITMHNYYPESSGNAVLTSGVMFAVTSLILGHGTIIVTERFFSIFTQSFEKVSPIIAPYALFFYNHALNLAVAIIMCAAPLAHESQQTYVGALALVVFPNFANYLILVCVVSRLFFLISDGAQFLSRANLYTAVAFVLNLFGSIVALVVVVDHTGQASVHPWTWFIVGILIGVSLLAIAAFVAFWHNKILLSSSSVEAENLEYALRAHQYRLFNTSSVFEATRDSLLKRVEAEIFYIHNFEELFKYQEIVSIVDDASDYGLTTEQVKKIIVEQYNYLKSNVTGPSAVTTKIEQLDLEDGPQPDDESESEKPKKKSTKKDSEEEEPVKKAKKQESEGSEQEEEKPKKKKQVKSKKAKKTTQEKAPQDDEDEDQDQSSKEDGGDTIKVKVNL
eukprot:TRINITY_DN8629_c0_g1_i1.p1 TRINITY_DN8629_c0_g1~~TRINITY_DN8629_c0_g1_i1.p1  ORF type:complete len:615 (+),score=169.79 TRINITY_DN8629_c0_g1_i1:48-1892(+)